MAGMFQQGLWTFGNQSIRPSIGAAASPSLHPKEDLMYPDGFVAAVILGLLALLLPVLWIGWWLLADLGEKANGTYPTRRRESRDPELRRAA